MLLTSPQNTSSSLAQAKAWKNVALTRRPLTSGQTHLTPKYRLKKNVSKSANIIHCVFFNDPKLPLNSVSPVSCWYLSKALFTQRAIWHQLSIKPITDRELHNFQHSCQSNRALLSAVSAISRSLFFLKMLPVNASLRTLVSKVNYVHGKVKIYPFSFMLLWLQWI